MYDDQGRKPFESDLPRPSEPKAGPQQQTQCKYTVLKELVNVSFMKELQHLACMRWMNINGVPYATVLEHFIKRAVPKPGGKGEITVIWRENPRAMELGLNGRQTLGA